MTYLSRFGLTHHQVTTLVDRFGSQVVPMLQRDPYVLVREIRGFGFKRGRQDRPQDGHAEGSAVAHPCRAGVLRRGGSRRRPLLGGV